MIWLLSYKVETNWISVVDHHMTESKRKNIWLPYGDLIKKYLSTLTSMLKRKNQTKIILKYDLMQ